MVCWLIFLCLLSLFAVLREVWAKCNFRDSSGASGGGKEGGGVGRDEGGREVGEGRGGGGEVG